MELKWSFSQTQRIPIGIVLFYLWVIYSTTATGHLDQAWGRPRRMNARSAFRIGRRPRPTALLPLYHLVLFLGLFLFIPLSSSCPFFPRHLLHSILPVFLPTVIHPLICRRLMVIHLYCNHRFLHQSRVILSRSLLKVLNIMQNLYAKKSLV